MLRHSKLKAALLLIATLAAATAAPATATNFKKPDWSVTMQTEEQKGVLDYKGSNLKNPVRVHVTCVDNTGRTAPTPFVYENIWYNEQGKLIGQEKLHAYVMQPQDSILISVDHKDSSTSQKEYLAAAEAALRFFLEASIHKGSVPAISVPIGTFDQIEQAMEMQNFSKYQPSIENSGDTQNKLIIFMTSHPDGRQQYLQYNR